MPTPPIYHDDEDSLHHEERRRQRLRRRRLVTYAAVGLVLAALGFSARPLAREIKAWQSRRLAQDANKLLEKGDVREAASKARDALQLRPAEPESWRPVARLLAQSGQSAGSLDWWKRLDAAGKLTPDDRRQFATAALSSGDLAVAAAQIRALLTQETGLTPLDLILAGQLAVRRGEASDAIDYTTRALDDKRAAPNEQLASAILAFSFSPPASPLYAKAYSQIMQLARDPANPMSLEALVFLGRQSLAPPAVEKSSDVAAATPAAEPTAALPPEELAVALESHPKARAFHQLLALDVRARQEPARVDEFAKQALERFQSGDDETVVALAAWLQQRGKYDAVLQLLPTDRALQNKDFFLRHIDALAGLERWNDVRQLLNSERFPLEPLLQHMYLAAAAAKQKEIVAERNEWQRAIEAADTTDKLMGLGAFAEKNSATEVADTAYASAINLSPHLQAAHLARLRLALAAGLTARAETVAAEMLKIWPENEPVRAEHSYLRLLLGAQGEELEKIERDAAALVGREPANWNAIAMLSLARFRQNKNAEALEPFKTVRATGAEPTGALAIRAAVLAVNGFVDGAKNDARNLATASLLPEERALLAPLMEQ